MSDPESPDPKEVTANPLFGASPSTDDAGSPLEHPAPQPPPAPRQPTRPAFLPPSAIHPSPPRSSLLSYIRRASYLFSIVLGVSASIALFWSAFLLPLLHASFSARRVIVEQQLERFTSLATRLRQVRSLSLPKHEVEERNSLDTPSRASASTSSHLVEDSPDDPSSWLTKPASGSGLTPDISQLKIPLKSLASALDSTSTTRTSVLTSLESYTSQLHRDIYLRNPATGASRMPVGLGTLSSNLNREAGASASSLSGTLSDTDARSAEWDAVRREVRAMKGLLLGRRHFTPT